MGLNKLPKRITMIREEQIEKAAEHFAELVNANYAIPSAMKRIIKCAFRGGAGWAELHPVDVWHEASEKPRAKEWILVQFEEDEYQTLALSESGMNTWFNAWVDEYRAIRWAYITDLLPKGGER